ncbi:MAG: FAD-binding and (Fe-S)-binding domain-containing protein [Pseudomonadota bacterium]
MIPPIKIPSGHSEIYVAFAEKLQQRGFEGDICLDFANRTVLSTDNSIYQILPQGVVYPKHIADLTRLTQLSADSHYSQVKLSPRGGGTGTNAQSLNDGLIVDTSKYMNRILEINVEEKWARVECGVVKDQLNAAIAPHGLFFAPELSTSNRATIGGMINTDASGQGSCVYGKTRDHVVELKTVLMDGSVLESQSITHCELEKQKQRSDIAGHAYRLLDDIHTRYHQDIREKFPKLNRCLTGYDLAHIRDQNQQLNLNNILCGSEGTLGFIAEAKLNLLSIPAHTALVNVAYDNFDSALRDANALMAAGPTSIETIDSRVLKLAQGDNVWNSVATLFPVDAKGQFEGVNLVEYTADSEDELKQKMQVLLELLKQKDKRSHSFSIARGGDVKKVWAMRKKAVGLLGNTQGEARPVAFVEDTAGPPEHLADFIQEFRQLLDAHQLQYGMFGHVDAGVLHVRPILDMKQAGDEQLIRRISDQVVQLTHKYGGLLWGEHGKGVRSEYSPRFFGSLYPLIQNIKHTFDPQYQLNPGKIATPANSIPLLKIDEVPTRGQYDKMIDPNSWQAYQEGLFCNGNGACHNWDPSDAMCPSWKATRKRTHTPKGRASLIREWLLQLSKRDTSADGESQKIHSAVVLRSLLTWPVRAIHSLGKALGHYDFSHEVHESMMGCLACKSCTGACPVKVDVPEFRSKFLELYYGRYLRPVKDYSVASLETMLPLVSHFTQVYNLLMGSRSMQAIIANTLGLSDSPLLSTLDFNRAMRARDIAVATPEKLAALSDSDKQRSVILVQDAFTRFFETELVIDSLDLLKQLGFIPWLAPYMPNGKPQHVHGFRKAFKKTALKNNRMLRALEQSGIPLIGIEPSMTLVYRGEYKTILEEPVANVLLIQEWLAQQNLADTNTITNTKDAKKTYKLLAHCTEKTNANSALKDWQIVFEKLGHQLDIIDVGCCGMAGTYGHETKNLEISKQIYSLSWQQVINDPENNGKLIASGFSCRSQTQRISQKHLNNPIQVLVR